MSDIRVQHIQSAAVGNSILARSIDAVSSVNSAVEVLSNYHNYVAGPFPSDNITYTPRDVGVRLNLSSVNNLNIERLTAGISLPMLASAQVFEYMGAPGGANEFIVRWRGDVTITGAATYVGTQSLSGTGIVNRNKCVPFIVGATVSGTGSTTVSRATDLTGRAWISATQDLLTVERGRYNTIDTGISTIFSIVIVEFTGSNWTISHGRRDNYADGDVPLYNTADGNPGTPHSVSNWNKALIIGQCRAPGGDNALGITRYLSTFEPKEGSLNTVRSENDRDRAGNASFVHVIENQYWFVHRITTEKEGRTELTEDISSLRLASLDKTLVFSSQRGLGGTNTETISQNVIPGIFNVYLKDINTLGYYASRNDTFYRYKQAIQIVDLVDLGLSEQRTITFNKNEYSFGEKVQVLATPSFISPINSFAVTGGNSFTLENPTVVTANAVVPQVEQFVKGGLASNVRIGSTLTATIGDGNSSSTKTFKITPTAEYKFITLTANTGILADSVAADVGDEILAWGDVLALGVDGSFSTSVDEGSINYRWFDVSKGEWQDPFVYEFNTTGVFTNPQLTFDSNEKTLSSSSVTRINITVDPPFRFPIKTFSSPDVLIEDEYTKEGDIVTVDSGSTVSSATVSISSIDSFSPLGQFSKTRLGQFLNWSVSDDFSVASAQLKLNPPSNYFLRTLTSTSGIIPQELLRRYEEILEENDGDDLGFITPSIGDDILVWGDDLIDVDSSGNVQVSQRPTTINYRLFAINFNEWYEGTPIIVQPPPGSSWSTRSIRLRKTQDGRMDSRYPNGDVPVFDLSWNRIPNISVLKGDSYSLNVRNFLVGVPKGEATITLDGTLPNGWTFASDTITYDTVGVGKSTVRFAANTTTIANVYSLNIGVESSEIDLADVLAPTPPTKLEANVANSTVTLTWDQSFDPHDGTTPPSYIQKYEIYKDDVLFANVTDVGPGVISSTPLTEESIGTHSPEASSSQNDYDWTITSEGVLDSTSDRIRFVGMKLPTNHVVTAKVTEISGNTSPFAKAGVIVRSSNTASASFVAAQARQNGGIRLEYRSTDGASRVTIGAGVADIDPLNGATPDNVWLQLRPEGDVWTGYYSEDGNTWSVIDKVEIPFPPESLHGIFACSSNTGNTVTATFEDLAISPVQRGSNTTTISASTDFKVRAVDNNDNAGQFSSIITVVSNSAPPVIEAPQIKNWNPGHYIRPGPWKTIAEYKSRIDECVTDGYWKGISILFEWKNIETSFNVFDWSLFDEALNYAISKNMQISLNFQAQNFNRSGRTSPVYIQSAPYGEDYYRNGTWSSSIKFWNAATMDRWTEVLIKIIERYGNESNVEHMKFPGESALGSNAVNISDYNIGAAESNYLKLLDNIAPYNKGKMWLSFGGNYWPNASFIRTVNNKLQALGGFGVGGPDTVNSTWLVIARGLQSPADDKRGIMPFTPNQEGSLRKNVTPTNPLWAPPPNIPFTPIYDPNKPTDKQNAANLYALGKPFVTHMSWSPYGSVDLGGDWATVKKVIVANNADLDYTEYPSSFPRGS
jgi:regulation of enolase protein 1 (concanavalin A-like superfamily)